MAGKKIIVMKRSGADGAQAPTPAEARADSQAQFNTFEQGTRLFRAGKFAEARELFQKAISGPSREISHHAQSHTLMCDRRVEKTAAVQLQTPEEHYNYAITLINARNLAPARDHLENALRSDPHADHVHYALALCRGLSGDVDGACENLKRAIELQPRNRVAARQDADFAALANHPLLHQILYPDRNAG